MNFSNRQRPPAPHRIALVTLVATLAIMLSACSAVQRIGDAGPRGRGFLEVLVVPSDAEIFVDEEYAGVVAGWHEQIVPVAPGMRKIELRAKGYITQRFDLQFDADEQVTLELRMQRELPNLDDIENE